MADALWLVDVNAKQAVPAASCQFHIDDLDPFGPPDALGDFRHPGYHRLSHSAGLEHQQKSGLPPTCAFDT
jgi:hypothetical protein